MIKYKEIKEKSSMLPLGYLIYLVGIWKLERNNDRTISISTRFWNPLSWLFCIYVFISCFIRTFVMRGFLELFRYICTITVPNFLSDINNVVGKAILEKKTQNTGWFSTFSESVWIGGDAKVRVDIIDKNGNKVGEEFIEGKK